jgi:hypothetical protein
MRYFAQQVNGRLLAASSVPSVMLEPAAWLLIGK